MPDVCEFVNYDVVNGALGIGHKVQRKAQAVFSAATSKPRLCRGYAYTVKPNTHKVRIVFCAVRNKLLCAFAKSDNIIIVKPVKALAFFHNTFIVFIKPRLMLFDKLGYLTAACAKRCKKQNSSVTLYLKAQSPARLAYNLDIMHR